MMQIEIERKFLVHGEGWRVGQGVHYRQGYICRGEGNTVRVRLGERNGWLTIKGPTQGMGRAEFEMIIPLEEAEGLLKLCGERMVEKRRYFIGYKGLCWVVDEFLGRNAGLVVAELELEREDQPFVPPEWVGKEVTGERRYSNAQLASRPYCTWEEAEKG